MSHSTLDFDKAANAVPQGAETAFAQVLKALDQHPDADALVEHALGARNGKSCVSESVERHVASCAECRELVEAVSWDLATVAPSAEVTAKARIPLAAAACVLALSGILAAAGGAFDSLIEAGGPDANPTVAGVEAVPLSTFDFEDGELGPAARLTISEDSTQQ